MDRRSIILENLNQRMSIMDSPHFRNIRFMLMLQNLYYNNYEIITGVLRSGQQNLVCITEPKVNSSAFIILYNLFPIFTINLHLQLWINFYVLLKVHLCVILLYPNSREFPRRVWNVSFHFLADFWKLPNQSFGIFQLEKFPKFSVFCIFFRARLIKSIPVPVQFLNKP